MTGFPPLRRTFRGVSGGMLMIAGAAFAGAGDAGSEPEHAGNTASRGDSAMLSTIVVTASRSEQALGEVAAQMEVLSAADLDRTSALFATDALKKNASIDVIQYPGGLSGVGMRGFRPEFSGTNQRVLLLVDGRPAGITSLGNLPMAGLDRVEVVKGSSSAVYGASAMGGVVNFISRNSRGPLEGTAGIGLGSFDTRFGDIAAGGSLGAGFDFDVALRERNRSRDFVMGNQPQRFQIPGGEGEDSAIVELGGGATRPNTTFRNRGFFGRIGYDISPDWRTEIRTHGFFGRDIGSPGAESGGTSSQASNDIDAISADIGIVGQIGVHTVSLSAFSTREELEAARGADGVHELAERRDTRFTGVQIQDVWRIAGIGTLTAGVDVERAQNRNRGFTDGERVAPRLPDDRRDTVGTYVDLSVPLLDDRLLLNAGSRYDRIKSEVLDTPLATNVTPGSESFTTFNPRAGVVFLPLANVPLRIHASAGSGFVAPLARQIAGESGGSVVNGQVRRLLSNPDLDPERSRTYDFGVGYATQHWGGDLTVFRTEVKDRIESVIVTSTPELQETLWVNASRAKAEGLEATVESDIGRFWGAPSGYWTIASTSTYFFTREQELPEGPASLRNIARFKTSLAADYDNGAFGVRVLTRHVRGMVDRDFSGLRIFTNGQGGDFTYPSLTIVDVDVRYRAAERHEFVVQVDNLTDRYYFEKNDYPMPGRAVSARYRYRF